MYEKIATVTVTFSGKQITRFNVYETEQDVYQAIPIPNNYVDPVYGPPYQDFYFAKVGHNWRSVPTQTPDLLYEIVTGAGLPARPLNKWY